MGTRGSLDSGTLQAKTLGLGEVGRKYIVLEAVINKQHLIFACSREKYFTFFSARKRAKFNKSCHLIGSWSGRKLLVRTATAGGIRQVGLFS